MSKRSVCIGWLIQGKCLSMFYSCALAVYISALTNAGAYADTITLPSIMHQKQWLQPDKPFRIEDMERQELIDGKPVFKGIVIHNTETLFHLLRGWTTEKKIQVYHQVHLNNKQRFRDSLKGKPWGGFAYHFYIDTDGKIVEGRGLEYIGDSGTNYDLTGLIQVVLEGNFQGGPVSIKKSRLAEFKGEYTGEPKENKKDKTFVTIEANPDIPTAAQKASLDQIVTWLSKEYKIDPSMIKGHKELVPGQTDCPGKNLISYLPTLKEHVVNGLAN